MTLAFDMRRIDESKVDPMNRVSITKKVRQVLDVQPGDFVVFYDTAEGLLIRKAQLTEVSSS